MLRNLLLATRALKSSLPRTYSKYFAPLIQCSHFSGLMTRRTWFHWPAGSTPLNKSFQPAACSASVSALSCDSVLGGASSPPAWARRFDWDSGFGATAASCCCVTAFHSSFNSARGLPVRSFHNASVYL